jgi:hypothetical protein
MSQGENMKEWVEVVFENGHDALVRVDEIATVTREKKGDSELVKLLLKNGFISNSLIIPTYEGLKRRLMESK